VLTVSDDGTCRTLIANAITSQAQMRLTVWGYARLAAEGFRERLLRLVEEAGGQNALARASGLSQSGINRLVQGGDPGLDTLQKLALATGRSVAWLAEGLDGEQVGTTYVSVPLLDIYASAGSGIDNDWPEVSARVTVDLALLRRLGIQARLVRGLRARGDSMIPTIADDALVLIVLDHDVVDGRVHAIASADGLRLKRVQRSIDGGYMLVSDNREQYAPELISAADAETLRIVGRAFWTERLL
jgi:transcriptional regulator with XRE-family HTH domain